jgi:hypothetical protein
MAVFRMIALASALWLAAPPAEALELAGTVAALRGSAFATGPSGLDRRLQVGSTILVGDRIATSPDGRLRLAMNDGAALGLGEASTITIAVYDVDESAGNAVLGFEGGVLLAESGAIARLGPGRFSIDTPVAFLDILAGRLWGDLYPDRLTLMLPSEGAATVVTPLGSVDLTQPETGLDVVPGEPPPQPAPWDVRRLEDALGALAAE